MSENLVPDAHPGFMRMVHSIWGGGPNFYPLRDKAILSVETVEDGGKLVFHLADERTLTYTAIGDCCSRSWIEHITVPEDIAGTIATGYSDTDLGQLPDEVDYEYIKVYQTALQTPKGEIVIEYRNSSNGYYGGWLEGPSEKWARDEIEAARSA